MLTPKAVHLLPRRNRNQARRTSSRGGLFLFGALGQIRTGVIRYGYGGRNSDRYEGEGLGGRLVAEKVVVDGDQPPQLLLARRQGVRQ